MKTRIIPVVLTAALTSLGTLFLAARFQNNIPYFTAGSTNKVQLPVNYISNNGSTAINATPPIDFQRAAEGAVKAVVHIKTTTKARTIAGRSEYDDFFGGLFGQRQYYIPQQMGSGSGVVVSPDGYIVTNNHVVAGADEVTVSFGNRFTTTAKKVGTDPSTDIAVLKVDEKDLAFMEFGNSDDVKLGQWVLAVGYPLTLDATVTAGIVSAKSRAIGINRTQAKNAVESFIQTDAAVNPGNSGGALVNTNGQLIGINSAIASPTGSYAGYSYAIPANIVRKVVNDLMKFGTVQRGFIGIEPLETRSLTQAQMNELKIGRQDGIYIKSVLSNGGASKAGLKQGDIITQVNGVVVSSYPELQEQLSRYKPGDNVSITYLRVGVEKMTTVELRSEANTISLSKVGGSAQILGATLRPLTAAEQSSYGVQSGLIVADLGTGVLARKTTMRKGFVVISVNDMPVSSVDDVQQSLAAGNGAAQLGGFYPGQRGMYYYGISNAGTTERIE
jgi:Do/DeqQ family serine protease